MQKQSRSIRASILIPLQRDERLFEETLLSVLENRPDGVQVIAVHNGTYTNPFDLDDEVDFATARSSNLVDLIRDGLDHVQGPIVHLMGTGMRATTGWLDAGLDHFDEPDVGAVDVMLDSRANTRAGWVSLQGRHAIPLRSGSPVSMKRISRRALRGIHLDAAFVRTSLLSELLEAIAPAMNDPVACAFAFGCLMRRNEWSVSVASDSVVNSELSPEFDDVSDYARGESLAAIEQRILGHSSLTLGAMLKDALVGSSSLGEFVGAMRCKKGLSVMRRSVDLECVSHASDAAKVLSLPGANSMPVSRAA